MMHSPKLQLLTLSVNLEQRTKGKDLVLLGARIPDCAGN